MGSDRDQRAGAPGDRIFGSDIHHDRHRAGTHRLDNIERGHQVAAGGIELDDQYFRIPLFGRLDAALDVVEHRRHDGTIRGHDQGQRRSLWAWTVWNARQDGSKQEK